MNQVNTRKLALDTLLRIEDAGAPSHLVIRNTLQEHRDLPDHGRAFYRRMVSGVLERKILLDYEIDAFANIKTRRMDPMIRMILRLAVYQIDAMDSVPDSAAVNEAVRLIPGRFRKQKGFVNAVLRNYLRGRDSVVLPDREREPARFLSVSCSMPEKIVSSWIARYGEKTAEMMCVSFQSPPELTVRLRGITPEQLAEETGTAEPISYLPDACVLRGVGSPESLHALRTGRIVPMDPSSMLAVRASGIRPGMKILDLCAAPGGKSIYAADLTGQDGTVTSRDLTGSKTELLRENAARCGVKNMTIGQADAAVMDDAWIGQADLVIADLPCSGLGVIRRKPDIRYHVTKEGVESLAALQRRILKNAVRYVKPGGALLYSTCTVSEAENEENVRWILNHSDLVPADLTNRIPDSFAQAVRDAGLPDTRAEGYFQLLPGVLPCDGFFISVFRKL